MEPRSGGRRFAASKLPRTPRARAKRSGLARWRSTPLAESFGAVSCWQSLSSFGSVAFRWLYCSSVAVYLAAGIQATATAWLALEAGGGGFGVGLVLAARMLPNLLFGL